jgi:hypothetical protein
MKILFINALIVVSLILLSQPAYSQWQLGTGSAIYYNSGNVGIGLDAPSTTLHIRSANNTYPTAYPYLRIGYGAMAENYTGETGGISFYKHYDLNIGAKIYAFSTWDVDSYNGSDLRFATTTSSNNGSKLLDRLVIKSNGLIGIGTNAPSDLLHVNGRIRWMNNSLGSDQGGSIELGGTNSIANTSGYIPYIDFHFGSGKTEDFNVRIINNGDSRLTFTTKSGEALVLKGRSATVTGDFSTVGNILVGTDKSTDATGNIYKLNVAGKIRA